MTVQFVTLIPNKITFSYFEGDLSIGELAILNDDLKVILNQATGKMHHISDVSNLKRPPVELSAIRAATDYVSHPNCGWVAVVGMNPLAQFLATIVGQLARNNLRSFKEMETALCFLHEKDASLPPLEELHKLFAVSV